MGSLTFLKPFWFSDLGRSLFSPLCAVCLRRLAQEGACCSPCLAHAMAEREVKQEGGVLSLFIYQGWFRDLLLRYKAKRHYYLYTPFSFWLSQSLPKEIDVIVLAPCSQRRQREEGVDPLLLIGRALAGQGLSVTSPFYKTGLSQKVLSKGRRKEKIASSLHVKRGWDLSLLKDKRVLLLDDIITTGSTLGEMRRRLEKAGVMCLSQAVLAQAQFETS